MKAPGPGLWVLGRDHNSLEKMSPRRRAGNGAHVLVVGEYIRGCLSVCSSVCLSACHCVCLQAHIVCLSVCKTQCLLHFRRAESKPGDARLVYPEHVLKWPLTAQLFILSELN